MTLEEYENIRDQMETNAEAGFSDLAGDPEPPSEPAYVSEGQREYMSTDSDDDD